MNYGSCSKITPSRRWPISRDIQNKVKKSHVYYLGKALIEMQMKHLNSF